MNMIEEEKVNVHAAFVKFASDQLRFPGSMTTGNARAVHGKAGLVQGMTGHWFYGSRYIAADYP
ncbi:MAG: hypothetical protein A3E79_04680 [Burkholderiales bacterium RIFCSPHIGHO2_12_FULL_61_11]|nr:MAG: hypothetical protein A3E79_04680 [Burkholderiales bacterium RIFCSPHIGHO2_12_FULL_61_11]